VVVDKFSKFTKFEPTKTIATMMDTTRLFFHMWEMHNGMVEVIVNDDGNLNSSYEKGFK
jgi:hypothetical protein